MARISVFEPYFDIEKQIFLAKNSSYVYKIPSNIADNMMSKNRLYDMLVKTVYKNMPAREKSYIIIADTKLQPVCIIDLSTGTLDSCIIDIRYILCNMLLTGHRHFFLAHNHPSGTLTASDDDLKITKKLKEASKSVGLEFVDHIIVGFGKCTSIKEIYGL